MREFVVAGKAFLVNLVQGVVCAGVGGVILRYIPPMRPDKMPEVRRRRREEEPDVWNS